MLGEIYGKIAMILVKPLPGYPEMNSRVRSMKLFIESRSYSMAESLNGIEKIVLNGITAMRNGLKQELQRELPVSYESFVLHGERCLPLKLELTGDEQQKAVTRVILTVMEAMHNTWTKEHLEELATKVMLHGMDDQFKRLFVPFPLLGWKLARRYYLAAVALFGDNQPLPDETIAIGAYNQEELEFCQRHQICDAKTLQQRIMEGAKFYPILSGRAEEFISREKSARRIAEVIMDGVQHSGVRN